MSRINAECSDSDPSDRLIAPDVLLRQEPAEDEDDEEDEEAGTKNDEEDDDGEGYSE